MEAGTIAPPENGAAPEQEEDGLFISTDGQLGWSVGGKRPDSSSLRLVGGKIDIGGQFEKGETVRLELTVTVGEVAFVDVKDAKTQQVVGCERRHRARITSIERTA